MDNFLFERPQRKEGIELNLVPIIDMLTTVIFFLLLSTVFIALNKLTVPPSRVSTISDPVRPPPLDPILMVSENAAPRGLELELSWMGLQPGHVSRSIPSTEAEKNSGSVAKASQAIIDEFHRKFPEEKTLRIGMERNVRYQRLISVMDGARELIPDIVLVSYNEAERRLRGSK